MLGQYYQEVALELPDNSCQQGAVELQRCRTRQDAARLWVVQERGTLHSYYTN